MYEIELKAHVYDREPLIRTLHSFAVFRGTLSKTDRYWSPAGAEQKDAHIGATPKHNALSVRVRREYNETDGSTRSLVTCKQKNGAHKNAHHNGLRDALEVNDETEFTVSDADAFEYLIAHTGLSLVLTKCKTCMQWQYERILIELCTVEHLGDFLELEILTAEFDADYLTGARAQLENLLKKCGIPLAQIEPMYYSELLQHIKKV